MATKNKTILDAFASLRRAVSLIKTTAAQDLEFGHNQISVLYRLSLAGHATMGDLIEQTFSDKASVTRTVSSLEKMGLVKRKTDDVDRRVSIIELTARGKLQAEKTHKIKSDIEDQLDTCLSVAETKQLCALTDKIIENLNKK